MSALLGLLSEAWPFVLTIAMALVAWLTHKGAQVAKAKAAQDVAESAARLSTIEKAEAEATATAAQAGTDAVKERANVENDIAATGGSAERLRNNWSRD